LNLTLADAAVRAGVGKSGRSQAAITVVGKLAADQTHPLAARSSR
jgi:hypothetical protein